MAAVIVLGAVAVATWLAVSPGGEEVITWDLFSQEREAAAVPLPDEATPLVLGLTMPGGMGIEAAATQSGLTMPGGLGTGE